MSRLLRELRGLPRNLWAASATSFLMDIASEMVVHLIPLFLANVVGVGTAVIGVIEGVAESAASVLKVFSGGISDRLGRRKGLAVGGYALSAAAKPLLLGGSWGAVAGARWVDRVGKGIRTAPRDALIADAVAGERRGLAFGLHRAADTAGALVGVLGALLAVALTQGGASELAAATFRTVVLVSVVPAVLAVLVLALGAREVRPKVREARPPVRFRSLGRPFLVFLGIVALFELGNSADAFLVLRAQTLGASVAGILGMLAGFNVVYALVSTPAGSLSDRVGRRGVIVGGWLLYGGIYVGLGLAGQAWNMWVLYLAYGAYSGLAYGTGKALVADLVPPELRGTAYGSYSLVVGARDRPASVVAGVLWQGFGPRAPFFFGASLALLAAGALALWRPRAR